MNPAPVAVVGTAVVGAAVVGAAATATSPSGLKRRSTQELLDRLEAVSVSASAQSRWYEPGKDFLIYSAAQDAVRLSESRLKKIKLTPAEHDLLKTSDNLTVVVARMTSVLQEYDRKNEQGIAMKRLGQFVNGFCGFATKVAPIVQLLLPQSPEYTVTFGLIMIVFKAVVDKKDKQEALAGFLETVTAQLPLVDFYEKIYPTAAMKTTVTNIYIQVVAFLDRAARYYCSNRGAKLIDAILQPIETQFPAYISRINTHVSRMHDLRRVALAAQQSDMQDTLNDAGQVIARLYHSFEDAVSSIGSSMVILNTKLEKLQLESQYITEFQAKSYVQTLRLQAFPDIVDADEELRQVVHRGFKLSQKDHWENNGILASLLNWSQLGRKALFWAGGKSGNQDTWVTELSVDLVQALDSQDKIVFYVFCAGPAGAAPTPAMLLRRLILQALEAKPLLALHNPERINLRRLKKAETFEQLWQLWLFLAEQMKDAFIIVDRIDQCKPSDNVSIRQGVLPRFIKMLDDVPQLSMIVTSVTSPPPEVQNSVNKVFLDTAIGPSKRYRHDP